MKKILFLALAVSLLTGVGCTAKEEAVITIDNIQITAEEFDAAFQASRFASMGDEGRIAFLDNYISLKLMLNEAEKMSLDRDSQFLGDIQSFWEKTLLKLVLLKKNEELTSDIAVSDREVRQYYQRHKEGRLAGKTLPETRDQIKWKLLQEKQRQVMVEWADSLRAKANIRINSKRLGVGE